MNDNHQARREWMLATADRHANELIALVEHAEPAIPADRRWLVALAVFVRQALPDRPTPTDVGEAMAAVSVALHEAIKP